MTVPCTALWLPIHLSVVQSQVGAWIGSFDVNQPLNLKRVTSAQNDEIHYRVFLSKGTYTITLMHHQGTDQSIRSIRLDGVEVGTIDGYLGVNVDSRTGQIAGVTVSESKVYDFSIKNATKNASSSGYGATLNAVCFVRTGGTLDETFTGDYPNMAWSWLGAGGMARVDNATKVFGQAAGGGTIIGGGFLNMQPDVVGHWGEIDVWLSAGTYNLLVLYGSGNNYGIVTASLDGTALGTKDAYAFSGTNNLAWTITGIVVPSDGLHTLRFDVLSKNAASSGYFDLLQYISLVKVT